MINCTLLPFSVTRMHRHSLSVEHYLIIFSKVDLNKLYSTRVVVKPTIQCNTKQLESTPLATSTRVVYSLLRIVILATTNEWNDNYSKICC